ncbi:MAG: single-stranded DNA-binding protein [Bacteroidota bacterium]|jgi:single-strand DNA-binding protein
MSVNKVILVGNVGKDPEVKYLDGNKAVARITIATNESYRDRNGQLVEQTEWHNVELWDDLARLAEKYVKKGKMLYIEGKIRTNKWVDKDTNQERQSKYIRANAMTFLGGGTGGGGEEGSGSSYNKGANTGNYSNNSGAPSQQYDNVPAAPEPMPDDDLPF